MSISAASIDQVVTRWSESGVKSKGAAANLAMKLAIQQPGTLIASREKIAVDLSVNPSTAQRARLLLLGAGIVYKAGTHLFVSNKAGDLK